VERLSRANGNDLEMITEVLIAFLSIILCKIINDVELEGAMTSNSCAIIRGRGAKGQAESGKKERKFIATFPHMLAN
jgi:hypothetical protein